MTAFSNLIHETHTKYESPEEIKRSFDTPNLSLSLSLSLSLNIYIYIYIYIYIRRERERKRKKETYVPTCVFKYDLRKYILHMLRYLDFFHFLLNVDKSISWQHKPIFFQSMMYKDLSLSDLFTLIPFSSWSKP